MTAAVKTLDYFCYDLKLTILFIDFKTVYCMLYNADQMKFAAKSFSLEKVWAELRARSWDPLQLSFYRLFSSGRSGFPCSRELQPLSRQACSLHAQQIMLNFSPEPNLPRVLMYYFMYTIIKTAAHSNAKEPPINVKDIRAFIGFLPPWFWGSDTDLRSGFAVWPLF